MEIETLNTMNQGMYASLMLMVKVIMLIASLFTVIGLAIYLAAIAWFSFEEKRQSTSAPRVPDTQARTAFTHKEPRRGGLANFPFRHSIVNADSMKRIS